MKPSFTENNAMNLLINHNGAKTLAYVSYEDGLSSFSISFLAYILFLTPYTSFVLFYIGCFSSVFYEGAYILISLIFHFIPQRKFVKITLNIIWPSLYNKYRVINPHNVMHNKSLYPL